jgi:hypothetical protein
MGEFSKVQDHGGELKKETTGAVRESPKGKGRYDLVPSYPMRRLAQHYENGAIKYTREEMVDGKKVVISGDRNWEKGLPMSRYLDSADRHIHEYMGGDRTEDHLTAAVWNLFSYIHTEMMVLEGKLPAALYNVPWEPSIPGKIKPGQ